MRRNARRLAVLALSTALALGGAELGLRLFCPVVFLSFGAERVADGGFSGLYRSSDLPGLEYELVPSCSVTIAPGITARTNSLGMRGPEVTLEKPAGVARIVVLGDSYTFGEGVGDEETLPSCLQRALGEALPGRAFEVLNFGVSGYSTRDEALVMRERARAFAPDLILLIYTLNDPETHPDHSLHRVFHRPEWWEHWHLVRLVALWQRARAVARHPTYEHYLHDPDEGHWSSVPRGFRSLADSAAEAGCPVLVAVMPMLRVGAFGDYPAAESHARVGTEARALGFEFLDLLEPLHASGRTVGELRNAADAHLSPLGNRVAAEAIARFLSEHHPELRAP